MTLDELKAFFLVDGAQFFRESPEDISSIPMRHFGDAGPGTLYPRRIGCTDKVLALLAEADRLQARVEELEECDREGKRIAAETLAEFMERPIVDDADEVSQLHLRIAALESSGAAAFNGWRTSSDVYGPMHVLREVVGAEFVDGQRKARNP
jgi:hypothetical protein